MQGGCIIVYLSGTEVTCLLCSGGDFGGFGGGRSILAWSVFCITLSASGFGFLHVGNANNDIFSNQWSSVGMLYVKSCTSVSGVEEACRRYVMWLPHGPF